MAIMHKFLLRYSAGRVGILEIRDAIIEMFHAEAEMSSTKTERIMVYEKLVKILQEQDKPLAEAVNAGRVTQMEFLRARASTLQAEIDLEKLRLHYSRYTTNPLPVHLIALPAFAFGLAFAV